MTMIFRKSDLIMTRATQNVFDVLRGFGNYFENVCRRRSIQMGAHTSQSLNAQTLWTRADGRETDSRRPEQIAARQK